MIWWQDGEVSVKVGESEDEEGESKESTCE